MWPFSKKPAVTYPFVPIIAAMREKDEDLYDKLCHLTPGQFWREWKKVYPEDFPQGGQSPVTPASIFPRKDR